MERVLKTAERGLAIQRDNAETLRMQGALLNEVLRQLKGGGRPQAAQGRLPDGARLPLNSEDEFRALEERLSQDEAFLTGLVSYLVSGFVLLHAASCEMSCHLKF